MSPDAPRAFFIERHHHHHHHYHHHSSSGETIPRSQSKTPTAIHRSGGSQPVVIKHSKHHKLQPAVHTVQPAAPVQRFRYSKCTGRKKALCIGINYRGQRHELRGCINDAKHIRNFLIRFWGYKEEDIVMLTDDSTNPRQQPTRRNMIDAMLWLVKDAQPNDSLFFHYSGHGGQTRDKDGDEVDGYDEVIFPIDFKQNGHIVDDEMHLIMVKSLPTGCRLTALFDCCHSGTALDLPYYYDCRGRLRGSHVTKQWRAWKSTSADVISWSASKDGQTSADTFQGGVAVGAMSYAFITSLMRNKEQSYQGLLHSIRKILQPKYSQTPQMGSSHHIVSFLSRCLLADRLNGSGRQNTTLRFIL
ncbi:caspase domain-containing protein [Armillaria borealis]|uniref:Caspase domain-containing protein n=1 Tax=Armillaria borealis TaxID=47425 RepID=A0AA39JTH4_9AGAR|nr:caspase domain-containing protein [Armillaria borealis]KAK0448499.1 caspase domain-containing protein [Armillaria borealis]